MRSELPQSSNAGDGDQVRRLTARRSPRTFLRAVLTAAVEDKLIDSNPASKIGKFNKRERGENKAQAMTASEAQAFLNACVEVCPDYYPLFFTALRSGLRKSELIALQWGDIQFGESEDDKNRFILVQRHYYMGHFGTSKTHECRRVDMTKQLRQVLMALKESALLRAFQLGKTSIADDLVFPSEAGTPISPDNIGPRYMEPVLEQAGLRKFRFHDLRHTFGSLLIQAGVSPAYVQKQMGHRSIQVTIDVYGHLIPGENVEWIDALDRASEKVTATDANRTQTQDKNSEAEFSEITQVKEDEAVIWLPPRDSNPDMLIQSQLFRNVPNIVCYSTHVLGSYHFIISDLDRFYAAPKPYTFFGSGHNQLLSDSMTYEKQVPSQLSKNCVQLLKQRIDLLASPCT